MFNLVVEPAVHEVYHISSHRKINTGDDLSEIEGSRKWSTGLTEAVHIITRVIRDHGKKSVHVGHHLTQDECPQSIEKIEGPDSQMTSHK